MTEKQKLILCAEKLANNEIESVWSCYIIGNYISEKYAELYEQTMNAGKYDRTDVFNIGYKTDKLKTPITSETMHRALKEPRILALLLFAETGVIE